MKKIRLDKLLLHSGLCSSLHQAQALIGAGDVTVDGTLVDKAGTFFPETTLPIIKARCPFVSRGGFKLKGGLDSFAFDPNGMTCLDIGASSGGFTDCLLQHGAKKVYAVDVAYGQLAWKLRQDERVIVIERFNARKISKNQISESIDLAVIDAAFISLTKLIPPLIPLFGEQVTIIALIKPQFELPRALVPKGGVVKDPEHHQMAIDKITGFAAEQTGLSYRHVVPSPILGPKGNKEFLLFLES